MAQTSGASRAPTTTRGGAPSATPRSSAAPRAVPAPATATRCASTATAPPGTPTSGGPPPGASGSGERRSRCRRRVGAGSFRASALLLALIHRYAEILPTLRGAVESCQARRTKVLLGRPHPRRPTLIPSGSLVLGIGTAFLLWAPGFCRSGQPYCNGLSESARHGTRTAPTPFSSEAQ